MIGYIMDLSLRSKQVFRRYTIQLRFEKPRKRSTSVDNTLSLLGVSDPFQNTMIGSIMTDQDSDQFYFEQPINHSNNSTNWCVA